MEIYCYVAVELFISSPEFKIALCHTFGHFSFFQVLRYLDIELSVALGIRPLACTIQDLALEKSCMSIVCCRSQKDVCPIY